jgi:hypothetical protein
VLAKIECELTECRMYLIVTEIGSALFSSPKHDAIGSFYDSLAKDNE